MLCKAFLLKSIIFSLLFFSFIFLLGFEPSNAQVWVLTDHEFPYPCVEAFQDYLRVKAGGPIESWSQSTVNLFNLLKSEGYVKPVSFSNLFDYSQSSNYIYKRGSFSPMFYPTLPMYVPIEGWREMQTTSFYDISYLQMNTFLISPQWYSSSYHLSKLPLSFSASLRNNF